MTHATAVRITTSSKFAVENHDNAACSRVLFRSLALPFLILALGIVYLLPERVQAANVQFVGNVAYNYAGNGAVLTANRVQNFDAFGFSGTLKLELWAFPSPYSGNLQSGYKLAEYTMGQLTAGFVFNNVNSGTVLFSPPPNGTWVFTLALTEFTNGFIDGGYDVRDYVNFNQPVVFGPPPPPPPAVTPQVGLWWNPDESGSGYAMDYKHGVLVVTVYSYTQAGTAQWYLASGPLNGYTFSAPLNKAINGQCISCPYKPLVLNGNDGTMTITFSSSTSATAYLPGGRVTQIQPQAF